MVFQIFEAFWFAVFTQISGAGAGDLAQVGHTFADQCGVAQRAGAQHAIDAFGDEVNLAIGLTDGEFDVRVTRHELRQGRDHEVPGQGAVQIHPQAALRRHAAKRQFGFFQFCQQLHATLVIRFAIQCRPHSARAAFQQAGAEPGFELIERVCQRGPRQVQVFRRQGKTGAFVDPHEHFHRFDLIHGRLSIVGDS
ncbi:hypothetical protein D3C85_1036760 [compost metagenome]